MVSLRVVAVHTAVSQSGVQLVKGTLSAEFAHPVITVLTCFQLPINNDAWVGPGSLFLLHERITQVATITDDTNLE